MTWEPPRVTFVFPRNLTGREHATFHQRLGSRHPGIAVDYWGADALDARLSTDEGRRTANAFFEEQDAFALAERMFRAGAPLRTGEDFLDAEAAIADGLTAASADYDWVIVQATTETPEPARTPGALMRLSFSRADTIVHADLVQRHTHPEVVPGVSFVLDERAQEVDHWAVHPPSTTSVAPVM